MRIQGVFHIGTVIAVQDGGNNAMERKSAGVEMNEKMKKLVSLTMDMVKASGGRVPDIAHMSEKEHQCAYLKAHFPAEWIYACAKLREGRRSGKVMGRVSVRDIGNMIREGKRVTLLPPTPRSGRLCRSRSAGGGRRRSLVRSWRELSALMRFCCMRARHFARSRRRAPWTIALDALFRWM